MKLIVCVCANLFSNVTQKTICAISYINIYIRYVYLIYLLCLLKLVIWFWLRIKWKKNFLVVGYVYEKKNYKFHLVCYLSLCKTLFLIMKFWFANLIYIIHAFVWCWFILSKYVHNFWMFLSLSLLIYSNNYAPK